MNPSNAPNKGYWLLPLVCVLIALLLSQTEPLQRLELLLLDSRFQARGSVSSESSPVQIVAIDDQTFSALDRTWPLERSLYADLIANLHRASARLIVLDVEFFESDSYNAENDSLLAAAIAQAGNVILASKMAYISHPNLAADYVSVKQPVAQLAEAAAGIGLVNEVLDRDGTVRRGLYYLEYNGQKKSTILGEILRLSGRDVTGDPQHNSFRINYRGPSATFPAISFSSVLDDSNFQLSPEIDSNYMERFYSENSGSESQIPNPFIDKIVLIGATAPDLHDMKQTPYSSADNKQMAGIEVLANAVTTCWHGNEVIKTHIAIVGLFSLLLGYGLFWGMGRFHPWRAFLLTTVSLLGLVVTAYFLFMQFSLWLELTTPGLTIILAHTLVGIVYTIRERKEKKQVRSLFSHYVPKRIIAELAKNPASIKLGGERREVTILFADIEDFTAISEKIPPEEMVRLLNQYMTEMTRIIQQQGGIIDKYEGDAIMAEFGVPGHLENHAEHACRAALRMQNRL
ncbi:adenylate/guanylate cyclase domain-containing protein, partial [bacterium]|nr:adenylate/guanylate cyclase domain-containing protein [bacterium]